MKLYTKMGDDGGTVLFDGTRVLKCDDRVAAYGELDELNAHIGLAVATLVSQRLRGSPSPAGGERAGWFDAMIERLAAVQHALFSVGAELATPMTSKNRDRIRPIASDAPALLERWIDEACAPVAELRAFVLPGGCESAAHLHVCRTVCRRGERAVVSLAQREPINPEIVIYLNRLSDLLFAWARLANHASGVPDVEWKS